MSDNSQPAFWLEVKKEYIIENFDKMLAYLEQYRYVEGADNASFMSTFVCLRDFVHDIFSETAGSNLCNVVPYEGLDDKLLVRIVAAYLLVCHKTGRQDLRVVAMLANRLLLMGEVTTGEMIENMRRLQLNCLRRKNVTKFVFGWNTIRDNDCLNLNHFAFTLSGTEFGDSDQAGDLFFENKGTVVVTPEKLRIIPMNYADYRKNGVQVQFTVAGDTEVCVDRRDRMRLDSFDRLVERNTSLVQQLTGVKPSPVKRLKTYEVNDDNDVLVRITRVDLTNVYARTVDPDYEVIEGIVYIPQMMFSVDADFMRQCLCSGMLIKVCIQNNELIPFRITEPFEDYYAGVADGSFSETVPAVFLRSYRVGNCWLTDKGVVVNVRDDNDCEEVNDAIAFNKILPVTVGESKYDNNDRYVTNGRYAFDSLCGRDFASAADLKTHALKSLIMGFVEACECDYIPAEEEDDTVCISDASCIMPMAYVLFQRANKSYISTPDRYENLMAALMIAQLCGADTDAMFIGHEMAYLSRLVAFAQGAEPSGLRLSHDAALDDNRDVMNREYVVKVLSGYEQDLMGDDMTVFDNDDVLPKVNDLVNASNILLHKISTQEINRIKKNITAVLGVGDMFKHNEDTSTYYGEENDTLEFKSSVVFPPVNKRDNQAVPAEVQRQMWNILKAVNGFLNSMSGGELLIGVMDNGYSCGVQEDIDYLYKNGKIAEASMDRYIQYIKNTVDYAFCDNSGTAAVATEITLSRVRYVSELNKENNRILRIQISPYEYGVVEFSDKAALPEDMASAYQRSSNTTMPLNKELKQQLEQNKLSGRADADTQKVMNLQKARKLQKAVILKGYNSKSGRRDRNVEPYKILLGRNAVICFDLDSRALREYKITRFEDVVITNTKWRHFKQKYNDLKVDLFDMLEGDGPEFEVVLKLGQLPYNLLLEECVGAEKFIAPNTEADKVAFPWVLSVTVYDLHGIGRFYMGLAHDIKIVKGEELKDYVREFIDKIVL